MPLPKAFLDVSIGGTAAGRITVQLRTDVAPKTCANFMALCTGEKGMGRCGRHLAYKGSVFHRIIPGFMAQGGDFQHFNGTGGESIYGPTFPDETFALRHSEAGTLAMANAGKDTNASQFYFTLNATTWLDSKHVVFGTVVAGMDVLKKVEAVGSKSGTPSKRVAIENCGIIDDDAVRKAHADEAAAKAAAQAEEQVAAQAARETRLPWVEDADAASARRLREMMQSRQQQKGSAAAGSAAAAAAGDGGAAGGPAREQGRPHPGGGAAADDEEEAPEALRQGDAVQAMDPRQRKLFELRLKLNESRKANQSAMVAEKKRKDNPDGLRQEAKRRATEGSAAASAEQLKAHGITDGSKYYLLQSLDEAEQKYAKQDAKKRGGGFGWDGFNQKASFNTYMKQTELMGPVDVEAYEAAKARDPSLAAADPESIAYGTQGTDVGPEALDRLVADMAAREQAQQKFSRRRTAYADRDADGINERNSHFNRKLQRTYGTYTAEIKAALERGTALP